MSALSGTVYGPIQWAPTSFTTSTNVTFATMNRIVNGSVSVPIQPGDTFWGCRYEISRGGTRVNSNLVPSLLTVDGAGKLLDVKGNVVQWCNLFTTDTLCWDHYRTLVSNHLKRLSSIVKDAAKVASRAIDRCPSVTTTIEHKELIDSFYASADSIK